MITAEEYIQLRESWKQSLKLIHENEPKNPHIAFDQRRGKQDGSGHRPAQAYIDDTGDFVIETSQSTVTFYSPYGLRTLAKFILDVYPDSDEEKFQRQEAEFHVVKS